MDGEADLVGESIGFFKIAPEDLPLPMQETLARAEGNEVCDSYHDVLRALVLADRFGCLDVTGMPWTEIDFPQEHPDARMSSCPRSNNYT